MCLQNTISDVIRYVLILDCTKDQFRNRGLNCIYAIRIVIVKETLSGNANNGAKK